MLSRGLLDEQREFNPRTLRQLLEGAAEWPAIGLENRGHPKGVGFDSSALRHLTDDALVNTMNHKRKRPRTKSRSKGAFPNGSPAWWNIEFNVRPKRRRDRLTMQRVMHGKDPDETVFDPGNHKPHHYYW